MFKDLLARTNKILLFVCIMYLLGVFIVGLSGDFPINDDWIFQRQIEAYLLGDINMSALIDPTFVMQGFLGFIWAKLFSASFFSLRILTVIVTLCSIFVFSKILLALDIKRKSIVLYFAALSLYAFNPINFTSSFTFMTENYFLLFMLLSIYFYLLYYKVNQLKYMLLGTLLCVASILVRQLGLFVFGAFLLTEVFYLVKSWNLKDYLSSQKFKAHIVSIALILASLVIWLNIPSYADYAQEATRFGGLIEAKYILERLAVIWYPFFYIGFFSLPVMPFMFSYSSKNTRILFLVLSVALAYYVYNYDLFPLGNIFYLEGLYTKSDFRINFSIFDNVPFKIFHSYFMSLSFLLFVYALKNAIVKNLSSLKLFLFSGGLLMYGFLFVSSDFYDRYTIPFFVFWLILVLVEIKEAQFQKYAKYLSIFSFFCLIFLIVALNFEFMSHTRMRWTLAEYVSARTGLVSDILVDGVYGKYVSILSSNDYTGIKNHSPSGNYQCFIQKYTVDSQIPIFIALNNLNEELSDTVGAPKVPGALRIPDIPKAKENPELVLYNFEYKSPLYNSVGKKAYVSALCSSDFTVPL